ncbi:hypothetical protein F2P56_034604 [Juglans regia]|uniref:Uncharacterized protein n=2 Tax=Juglans regia TaxID=51240 RepID=A0A833TV57_JUGRE|nr:uncharacterized protein LOC108993246 [Juglans regia]KAF5445558.1 hypothetical protein F2P56_034604 [Juglans regia]
MALLSRQDPSRSTRQAPSRGKDRPLCSHCGFLGHIVERCYKLHGYPPGFKSENKAYAANVSATSGFVHATSDFLFNLHVSPPVAAPAMSFTPKQYQQLISLLNSTFVKPTSFPAQSANLAFSHSLLGP